MKWLEWVTKLSINTNFTTHSYGGGTPTWWSHGERTPKNQALKSLKNLLLFLEFSKEYESIVAKMWDNWEQISKTKTK